MMAAVSSSQRREARIIHRIDDDVAVAQDKGIDAGKIARQFDHLPGAILHHLGRVVDADAEERAVAESLPNDFGTITDDK